MEFHWDFLDITPAAFLFQRTHLVTFFFLFKQIQCLMLRWGIWEGVSGKIILRILEVVCNNFGLCYKNVNSFWRIKPGNNCPSISRVLWFQLQNHVPEWWKSNIIPSIYAWFMNWIAQGALYLWKCISLCMHLNHIYHLICQEGKILLLKSSNMTLDYVNTIKCIFKGF